MPDTSHIPPSTDLIKDERHMANAIAYWYLLREYGGGDLQEGFCSLGEAILDKSLPREKLAKELLVHAHTAANKFVRDHPAQTIAVSQVIDGLIGIMLDMQELGVSTGLNYYLRAGWYDRGMPTIELGHKLAASFMVTSISESVLAQVQPPFRAFLINIPDGLVKVHDHVENKIVNMRSVLVGRMIDTKRQPCWMYYGLCDSGVSLWRYHKDLDLFVQHDVGNNALYGPADADLSEIDERAAYILGRLIVSVMLFMTNQEKVRPIGKGHGKYNKASDRRLSPEPTRRVFQLVADVKHDFRETVRSYMSGSSNKLTVQGLVTSHWKNQPHGPEHALRKYIHIEDYWRGPDDAPIALRKHQLEKGT